MLRINQLVFIFLSFSAIIHAQMMEPVKWTSQINDSGEIVFQAKIENGWHLYDMNLPDDGPIPTAFNFEEIKGAELIGKVVTKSKIVSQYDNMFKMTIRWFGENPTFTQKLKITDKDNFLISGSIDYMACNDQSCVPGEETFNFTAKDVPTQLITAKNVEKNTVSPETIAPAIPEEKEEPATAAADSLHLTATESVPETVALADYWQPVITELQLFGEQVSSSDKSWLLIFIVGFGGGLLALLTPCVWPIIPMTVSFFLKRAKTNRKKAISDALTYGFSIIVIYLLLGLIITAIFGASALNDLSTNAVFNLLFFALLVVFAISFFGAFELVLPSSWTNKMDSKAESTTGLISIFFMAFTLVLVSFSCTGPIIGTLLVEAAGMGSIAGPAIGMFGFSLALAIPFALFALFPSWLQNLPKSGGWLNAVKVVLGFLELALALKFLSVADLAYGWGLLDREVFLVIWIVLFVLLGIYLLGKIKFAHDSDLPYVPVPRLFLAIISFAFAIYMIPGLWGAPLKAISAFSPPLYTQDFSLYHGEVRPQFYDFEEGMEYARKNHKPVMIDFTGYGCVNCREMEAAVWSDPRVKAIIDNDYVLISLYVDDKTKLNEPLEIMEYDKTRRLKTIGDKWSYLQRSKFGANAQPFYVLLDNTGMPVAPAYAYNKNIDKYLQFLQEGREGYKLRIKN
ncbi:MAG: thioredoxin family protein [Candidatus Symbiothrix sp.]|jgi:thiol:disulfide interchange protein DsbD|nr:thioredoxin family protein [Candidatus Symbiothrix sp.]